MINDDVNQLEKRDDGQKRSTEGFDNHDAGLNRRHTCLNHCSPLEMRKGAEAPRLSCRARA